ncbi:MAG: secretin N-terminal domain-containing protein [Planctomycetota bacterium]
MTHDPSPEGDLPQAATRPARPADAGRSRRSWASAVLAALLALALGAPAAAQGDEQEIPPIQEVDGTYVLNFAQSEGDEGMSLYQFVQACQQVTGRAFTWSPETESLLKNNQVHLIGSKSIAKARFYQFFQVMMIISNFVCTEVGEDDIAVIKIDSLEGGDRGKLRSGAVYVDESELAKYADQPATLIATVVTLPNTDVRQVSNNMRTLITDANTQQMLPAGGSNSMVLVGFGSSVVAMAEMLRIVDEASKLETPTPVFDMVRLEYALADDIQPIIEELLEADTQTRQQQIQQQQAAGLNRTASEASISVDPRLNALLITALPDQMPRIKELIARLDVDIVERERTYHIYALENVSSEDLAETLNDFLDDAVQLDTTGSQGTGRGGNAPQRSNNNNREFVVVADPETNSLLVAANRSRYQELRALIEQLDRRQDQVLIETALVELSGRDFLDIGVELGFADIPGTDQTGGAGVTSFGLSSLTDTDGDGIFDLRQPNVAQGVTAAIIDGGDFSIPALLALLETKDNSNVLNVPSVLVNNNSRATVSTLDEQPTTQITATGGGVGAGQTQENFAEYVEAGITMQISPSISASRYLRLEVYLEVSTFIGSVQNLTIPPPRVTRTIETQINVPDGATMVIGGIVVDNESEQVDQVPLLGDIPLLGLLFKREQVSRNRTVLYFFVTPHILQDKDFADLAEISFQKKLEMTRTIGIDRLRRIDPDFGIAEDEQSSISLEGFDLPLYKTPVTGEVDGSEVGLTPVEATRRLNEARQENR